MYLKRSLENFRADGFTGECYQTFKEITSILHYLLENRTLPIHLVLTLIIKADKDITGKVQSNSPHEDRHNNSQEISKSNIATCKIIIHDKQMKFTSVI